MSQVLYRRLLWVPPRDDKVPASRSVLKPLHAPTESRLDMWALERSRLHSLLASDEGSGPQRREYPDASAPNSSRSALATPGLAAHIERAWHCADDGYASRRSAGLVRGAGPEPANHTDQGTSPGTFRWCAWQHTFNVATILGSRNDNDHK